MNNQPTWNCSYCGRVDNTGSTCPSCGANRPQTDVYAPDIMVQQDNSTIPATPWIMRSLVVRGCLLLFLVPFVCAGLFVIGVTVSVWHDYQELSKSGTTTQATVTTREVSSGSSKSATTYNVKYRFAVNERNFSGSDTVDADTYSQLEQGAKITIRYAQTDPTISHIGDNDSNELAIVMTVFSVCWNGILLIFFVALVRGLLRRRRYN